MTPEYLTHPAITVPHGFFTRRGGVSHGPYASLNASLSGGDDVAHVTENRARIAAVLGVPADHLLGLRQVHGTDVITVHEPWPPGQGPTADALVTATAGIAIGIITADCAPVLFHDAQANIIGAAHAGWRGAAAGILEATAAAMAVLGARHIVAVVGPCIGQDSYEVGPDLYGAVTPTLPDAASFFQPGRRLGRWQFDLPAYCVARLDAAGIQAAHALGLDTLPDHERFFSHRRRILSDGGPIGHQISALRL